MTLPILAIRPEPGCSATVAAGRSVGLAIEACPLVEIRPVSWFCTGVSAKGLTGFRRVGTSRLGDFKGYLGFQVGPVALEGGYRYAVTDLRQPGQELDYVLFGPYASLSLTLRF